MDALALLCNLHGDGPATLAGLRAAGTNDLAGLERLTDELLGELLAGAAPSVARFRREGRLLLERIEGPAEDEGLRVEPAEFPAVQRAATPAPPANTDQVGELELQDEARLEVLPEPIATDQSGPIGAAPTVISIGGPADPVDLAARSERDLLPRPSVPAKPSTPLTPPPAEPRFPVEHDPVVTAVLGLWNHLDRGPQIPENGTLAESRLDGLRPEQVVLLAQTGIRTLTELAEADTLSISGRIAIPYTHLAHLRFLARKLLRSRGSAPRNPPPPAPGNTSPERAQASQPPEEVQADSPAGGPFA